MKRKFTSLLAAVLMLMSGLAWGQMKTTVTDQLTRESTGVTSTTYASWSGVTSNSPAVYAGQSAGSNNSIQLRSNNSNSGIITTTSGGTVMNVTVTWNSNTTNGRTLNIYGKDSAYSSPTDLYDNNAQGTLIGTIVCGTNTSLSVSDSYAFIGMRSASGAMYLEEIDITWSTGGGTTPTAATPSFSPAAGTYYEAQNVTISCNSDGATIYYTTDGNNPTTSSAVYSTPIAISQTTTVKAMAAKAGMNNSNVATATYTIQEAPSVITIAAAKALALNEYALVQGVVTFIDGKNVYVQDETAGIDLYLNSAVSTLALGDKVQAYGKRAIYNGLIELTGINPSEASQFSVISTGNPLPLAVKSISEILNDDAGNKMLQSTRVQIVDATVGTINNNNNTPITQNDSTLNIYKMPVVEGLAEGDIATVIGVIGCYNAVQLRVASAADVTFTHPQTETVATPTFNPAAGTFTEEISVAIACVTEGASIYYTLDGSDPSVMPTGINGNLFEDPITISENTTVKAIAVKEGMNNSEIATAVYEFSQPTPPAQETSYTLIKHNNALVVGDKYIVVGIKGEGYKALGKQATNNRTAVDVTPVDEVITLTPATTNEGGVFELTLGQAEGYWTLYDAVNEGYLYAASSSANHLKVQAENDANGQWTIDIDTTGVATIKAQGQNSRNWLRLNTSGSPFSCYVSGQLDVYLYKAGDVPTPPTPTNHLVSVAQGITNGTVTVNPTTAQAGATITVTATPETNYELATLTYYYEGATAPIDIKETKQFTMPDADVTVNATFTEQQVVITPITIAEARALELNEYALVQGVVTFIDGRNVYVQDETAGIDLYLNANAPATLSLGDKVQGYGKKAVYKGLIELSGIDGNDASQFSVISTGNPLPLAVKSISDILNDDAGNKMLQSTRVQIVDATVGTINNNNNTPITQNDSTLNIYKMPVVEGLLENDIVTVIGVIGCYNAVQLRVANAADVTFTHPQTETVATPTFNPAAGTFTEEISVAIACVTEGASIYYTLDGTDPNPASTPIVGTLYTEPIALSDSTTVKAIAVKEGMNNSEIATAVYVFTQPTPPAQETAYTLIKHNNALVVGDKYIVVGIKGEGYKALGKQATNNRTAVDVTPVDEVITLTPATTNEGGVFELTLGQAEGYWTLYDAVNEGYLYAASSSANHLKVQAENDANGQWTIDIDTTGVATIKAQGQNSRNWLRLNTSGSPFSCYASGQLDVYLYKAGEVPTPPTPSYFNISIAAGIANGTVTVDTASYLVGGETITVTAQPELGYELSSLTYSYGQTTINISLDTMQFVMPAADVIVNATFTELAHVANPTFTPAAGSYITEQEVAIASATEGATIYYTTDGTDPTTESTVYEEPFTVSATTTVKAFAVKEGLNNSSIVTALYTIIEPITIAEARALENNEYALVQGVVTFMDGRNIYVQDETAGIDLYLNSNTVPETLAVGDMVLAYGKKTVYNGLVELTSIAGNNANQFQILSNGNELPVAVKTIAEILADHEGDKMLQSTRVQIVDATIGAINNNNNTPITQDGSTLNIYKMPVVEGLEEEDIVTVVGILGCYNTPQLRVNSASDVTFVHPAKITINPTSLSGFNYVYEEGPSTVKTFQISARSLTAATHIIAPESYELSSFPGENFYPENHITINTYTGVYNYTIKVRLKAGLEVGNYEESIVIYEDDVDTLYLALNGSVTSQPQQSSDYVRISDISMLGNGSKVIFAARYNENADEYFAMTAQASGKPEGVLFNSVIGTADETLPSSITDAESTYYWTVTIEGTNYTFTNANGDVLGYTSGTNFATGGDNTAWAIEFTTAGTSAMVPEYSGFVISNVNNAVRAFALNSNHNFGPYHTQNNNSESYNFYLDMFVTEGTPVTPTAATPVFSVASGTYFEEFDVEITCATEDATIYYTTDGTDPTDESEVYDEPIHVAANMTLKAIAMKEDYNNSNIATAEYTIMLGVATIFYQDWEGEMNGWTFVTVEGSKPWNISSYSGNHYAYANGYNGGANEQWCISPAFNLDNYEGESLTFRNAMNYNGPDLELYYSNDYDGEDPTNATWIELEFEKSTGSFAWSESGAIDLSELDGTNCYIGFKYISTETEAAAWEIDDILLVGLTSEPYLTVAPTALSGFTHHIGEGPSASQTFVLTAGNISPAPGGTTGSINVSVYSPFEISLDDEEYGDEIFFEDVTNLEATTIYVRMNGTEVGQYSESVSIYASSGNEATVALSGTVTEQPTPGGDWNRILSLSDLADGDQVIIAARYDATIANGYYAMTAGVSGKPDGVLFTSVTENGVEMLPAEIASEAATYFWNVTLDGYVITLTNANGDQLGYSSSTNFAANTNTEWNIALETSSETALIPNYTGFVITNGTTTNRGIAKNNQNKFGAYAISNMTNPDYSFFLDLFVMGGTATPTVATPVFSVASGTYFEEFDVEITCATEDATIYYTTDGSDPTDESEVYTEPIHVDDDMTIKAIAMKDDFNNSNIATVEYTLLLDVITIFHQNWEVGMEGWTFVTIEGNKPWEIGEHNNNHYAMVNGYGDEYDNEQWCISPAFNLNNYEGVTLTFMNAMKFNGPALELYFSNDYDGQDPGDATWEPLEFNMSSGNYEWTESGEISLDEFSGTNCYIGFRYISTVDRSAAAWEIDDILLTAEIDVTGVNEMTSMEVNLWNTGNEMFVENNTNSTLQMVVFNVLGQQVFAKNIAAGSVRFTHNLTEGLYIVTLQNSKERMTGKVVVR